MRFFHCRELTELTAEPHLAVGDLCGADAARVPGASLQLHAQVAADAALVRLVGTERTGLARFEAVNGRVAGRTAGCCWRSKEERNSWLQSQ